MNSLTKRASVWTGVGIAALGAVYVYVQYTPEVDPKPSSAPVNGMHMSSGRATELTTDVKNPAGLTYLADSGTFLVSTDDRVVAEISGDFSTVLSSMTVPANPLGTGDTEGVVYLGNDEAAVLGENGVVVMLKRDSDNWVEQDRYAIEAFTKGTQLGSAAFDPDTSTLYSAQKKGAKVLYTIDLATRTSSAIPMALNTQFSAKQNRNWEEFTIAGLQFHEGKLYGVSEAFSSLLTISTDGAIEEITGVENINESSGITIRDGVFTLIGDAENYLPSPPVYLIDKNSVVR